MKAVRGTVAFKGIFENSKGRPFPLESPFLLRDHRFPLQGIRSACGPLLNIFFNKTRIVGRGPDTTNCQGSGVFLRT